jgi:two-component system, OmpR family, sensor kinase
VTLRARVALAAATAIVLAVVLLAIAVPAVLSDQLRGALDDDLQRRAAEVAQLNAATPAQLTEPGALEGRLGGSALLVEVLDRRGRIVVRSSGLGGRLLPFNGAVRSALQRREPAFADDALGTDRVRMYAAPLGSLGRGAAAGGAVVVAGTTSGIQRTLDHTRTLVLLCALVAGLLAAGLATWLTRRALRPLTRLSAGARAIERSGDAAERLPEPPVRDEVGELAGTLNAMLASLERAREAEHRFVGDASHELRTPLTALRGNAAYVARHGADPAVLADIEADAARLSALLESLLALAREDAAAPVKGEPVDLAELARGLDAEVDAPAPVWVLGERPALERALENLVANAHRHGRGRVTVTVGARDGWAQVTVADEGPGIPPEQAARAFERFWRAPDARGEGSGLGLAIVRAIAERHGGRVTVDGPRFTLAIKELSKIARTTDAP